MNFNSKTQEAKYYIIERLKLSEEVNRRELKEYISSKSNGINDNMISGALNELKNNNKVKFVRSGVYSLDNTEPQSNVTTQIETMTVIENEFDRIINEAINKIKEICKVDISEWEIEDIQKLKEKSAEYLSKLESLLERE